MRAWRSTPAFRKWRGRKDCCCSWPCSAPWCWRNGRNSEMVPTNYYVILSAILFGLGVFAFIFKRNVITIFMSIELMLNAVNLAFVAFSQALGKLDGQVFVLFVIVVAAAEAAV